jgi:hypothetical protein
MADSDWVDNSCVWNWWGNRVVLPRCAAVAEMKAFLTFILLFMCASAKAQVSIISSNGATRLLVNGAVTVTNSAVTCSGPLLDTTNLVAAYMWQEGSGTTSADLSGSGNTATLTVAGGTPSWTTQSGVQGALTFNNANNGFVSLGSASSLNPSAMTVEAWVNFSNFTPSYSCVTGSQVGSGTYYNNFYVTSAGKLAVYIKASGGVITSYDGGGANTLSTGTWTFIAYTISSSGLNGYVNGVFDQFASASGTLGGDGETVEIGNDSPNAGRIPNATIGAVYIYNTVKSLGAIQYDQTVTCP